MKQFALSAAVAAAVMIVSATVANAHKSPVTTRHHSANPRPSPRAHIVAAATPAPSPAPSAVPSGSPQPEGPVFYNMVNDINSYYNVDRDATLYYQFRNYTTGKSRAKYEFRYGRNLWNNNAVVRIRIPFYTQYPVSGNPYSGLGNIELGYSYNVPSKDYDHSMEFRISLPTAVNNVNSNDTQIKGFYTSKWKSNGASWIYNHEYDQSIIVPPGSSWTSYYEGKITGPNVAMRVLPWLKWSGIYNFRILFDTHGLYKQAAGGTLFGNLGNVALSLTDTWGGTSDNSLWKYQFEFNMTGKF
jgi:hypothetical protein